MNIIDYNSSILIPNYNYRLFSNIIILIIIFSVVCILNIKILSNNNQLEKSDNLSYRLLLEESINNKFNESEQSFNNKLIVTNNILSDKLHESNKYINVLMKELYKSKEQIEILNQDLLTDIYICRTTNRITYMPTIHYLNRQSKILNIVGGELYIDNIMQLHNLTTINIINNAANYKELLYDMFKYKNIKNFNIFNDCENDCIIEHFMSNMNGRWGENINSDTSINIKYINCNFKSSTPIDNIIKRMHNIQSDVIMRTIKQYIIFENCKYNDILINL